MRTGDPQKIYQPHVAQKQCCVADGCEKKPKARNLCMKHYQRWKFRGDPNAIKYGNRADRLKLAFVDLEIVQNCLACSRTTGYSEMCQKHYKVFWNKWYAGTDKGKAVKANARYRRKTAAKDSDVTTEFLLDLWDSTKTCVICDETLGVDRHLDHILPICIGGTHSKNNVRYIHAVCNMSRPRDGSDISLPTTV